VSLRAGDDSRGTCALGAALFARPDFAFAAGGGAPELLWLLGSDGLRRFEALRPEPPAAASRLFPSGYAVMRSGWTPEAHHLIADAGPLGCPASSGHGHADLLSVQLSIFGDPCLVDAGTGSYTPEPAWRMAGRRRTGRRGSMGSIRPSRRGVPLASASDGAHPLVALRQDGGRARRRARCVYAARRPVTCRRRVVFVKPDYWVVDDLEATASHHVELIFQFAPDVRLTAGPERGFGPRRGADTRCGYCRLRPRLWRR
jgi:hypothetical protein